MNSAIDSDSTQTTLKKPTVSGRPLNSIQLLARASFNANKCDQQTLPFAGSATTTTSTLQLFSSSETAATASPPPGGISEYYIVNVMMPGQPSAKVSGAN